MNKVRNIRQTKTVNFVLQTFDGRGHCLRPIGQPRSTVLATYSKNAETMEDIRDPEADFGKNCNKGMCNLCILQTKYG